jgi:hypothetical protein
MSSNNEDEFGDCLLGDNDLLIIDIDTDHLSQMVQEFRQLRKNLRVLEGNPSPRMI